MTHLHKPWGRIFECWSFYLQGQGGLDISKVFRRKHGQISVLPGKITHDYTKTQDGLTGSQTMGN